MNRPILLWLGGILVFIAVLASLLTANVYGDRGRDEINMLTIHEALLRPGESMTQAVALQRPGPVAIRLPYQWLEQNPALVVARITDAGGAVLAETTEALSNSRVPVWQQPVGDGSFWQNELATFHTIPVPSSASGTVYLRITRVDQVTGYLVFFISELNSAPNPLGGSGAESRSGIVERLSQVLDLETVYGSPRPAVSKLPTYVSRLQSIAPPWLPFPMPELLLAVMVGIAIYFYTAILFRREPRIT